MTAGAPFRSVLLVGPTGSGKTPLGRFLEVRGFQGRPCAHFDFGGELRKAAAEGPEGPLSETERSVVRLSLETGALLNKKDFPIAGKLLASFVAGSRLAPDGVLVLNGFPRDPEQAEFFAPFAAVELVIELRAPDDVILERIGSNAGGDRAGRSDDARMAVMARLAAYGRRTVPLIAYYSARGVDVVAIKVLADMTAAEMAALIPAWVGPGRLRRVPL